MVSTNVCGPFGGIYPYLSQVASESWCSVLSADQGDRVGEEVSVGAFSLLPPTACD